MALFGMMMWISLALAARAADDPKATGEKKDANPQAAKSEPSNAGAIKLAGKAAPDIGQSVIGMKAIDPQAEPVSDFTLSDYRGKNTMVVAFFTGPKDSESVDELCQFRDLMTQFKQNNVIILGISNSPLYKERHLVNKEKVGFLIMGDEHGVVCGPYGVIEKGKVSRVTFIIDQKGIVRKVIDTKDPKKHVQEVLDFVKNLKS
jgi:peroxiredoxin